MFLLLDLALTWLPVPLSSLGAQSALSPSARRALDMQVVTCLLWPRLGDVFKALADPTRRTILDELTARDGQTLFEICARLATKHQMASSRQAISTPLEVL